MDGLENFDNFFKRATGFSPYPYQRRWALTDEIPSLVSIPTGLGKTAGAILSWVWRRRFADEAVRKMTPRRLVYCLPMRVLVEQTLQNAEEWINCLGLGVREGNNNKNPIRLCPLLGGDVEKDWDIYPERDVILVGTQDMLLSRALNRGYAMSRFRWPVHFALLNNDCLWVMDEVQLMGNGLATSTQLQAFRRILGTLSSARSVWMSATIRRRWLGTVDFDSKLDAPGFLELSKEDLKRQDVSKRVKAKKPISPIDAADSGDIKKTAAKILFEHRAGTLTLVVVNTVKRAIAIYDQVRKKGKDAAELLLIHSRFRPPDRQSKLEKLTSPLPDTGRIAITTQVVEAGVDVSATTLFTDLAPWPSMIQRFGRNNRRGEDDRARVFWFDLDISKKSAPYESWELGAARINLESLGDASPDTLPEVNDLGGTPLVLRRRDLLDLFDTTPDLAGADIDVSRFIRDTDDHDLQIFWRDWAIGAPDAEEPAPSSYELCPVPIGDAREVMRDRLLWRWDHQEKRWARPEAVFPGLVLMMQAKDGGYSSEYGWTGKQKDAPAPVAPANLSPEGIEDDRFSESDWETLKEHNDSVINEIHILLKLLTFVEKPLAENLLLAGRWHDVGKAHFIFRNAIANAEDGSPIWAKAPKFESSFERRGFRHELASALAMLQSGLPDIACYLAGAHHGKVRLSIRSLPNESPPPEPDRRFARGIWEGDNIGAVNLGGGVVMPKLSLDLSCMELGDGPIGPSWLSRMLSLRDDPGIGPFRLAFLETLLRVADWRASARKEGKDA